MRQVTRRPRSDGRAERDEAVARVDRHAPSDWKQEARDVVSRLAHGQQTVHPDDVWDRLTTRPAEPRALGAIMVWARNQGLIEVTDEMRESERPEAHRNPKRVWRSLVYRLDAPDPRAVPAPTNTALPERALDEVVHKMRRGKAQSKTAAPARTPRPKKTPEEIEELQRRGEEQLQRQIDARR
jgi:hypothetical protein